MTQTAVVREVLPGGLAAVEVRRTSACGEACGACGLCGEAPPMRVTARNLLGAAAGDLVTLSTDGRRVLGLASVVYLLPLLFFFAGYAVGVAWRLSAALTGAAAFVLGFAPALLIGRHMRRRGAVETAIVAYAQEQ